MRKIGRTLMIVAMSAVALGAAWAQPLTRHDLGRTVKFKILVDKVMQPTAGWHTEEWMVREAAEAGFNVFSPRRANDLDEVRQVTEWCAKYGILHLPWMRGSLAVALDDPKAEGRRMVWASGAEQPLWSPNSDAFWEWTTGLITEYARISREMPALFGVFLDYENYAPGPKGGNCYSLSYDAEIMQKFAAAQGITLPELAPEERYPWLKAQGLHDEFEAFQIAHWRERCRALRQAVDAIDPTFQFCVYPAPGTPFMIEAIYPEWATEAAPLILADAITYGRSAILPHEEALKANRDALVARRQFAESTGIPMFYTGGIDPVVKGADPEFSGRNAAMISQVTDGYWIFYEGPTYETTHRDYFKWFAAANRAIDAGDWDWAWQPRETPDSWGLDELPIEHPERKQLVVYGWKKPFMQTLQANEEYEVHDMAGSSLNYLSGADVVILQNFNQSLPRSSNFVQTLIRYVEQGGGLMLAHDTAWFMASPFPQIAVRGYPTQRVEAERHVVETDLIVQDVRHPALRRVAPGTRFTPEFRDHMIFKPGDAGTVLVRNEFGDPVYVAGEVGEGRVVYVGSYFGYRQPLEGAEQELLWSVLDWLAGEGPGYRPPRSPMQRHGLAVPWPNRPGFK